METSEFLANVILAIKSDRQLKECFLQVLSVGPSSQQVRVGKLQARLLQLDPPPDVLKFVQLLGNDQIAGEVLRQLEA